MTVADVHVPAHRNQRRQWRAGAVAGVLFIVAGLGMAGYIGWQYVGTNIVSKHKQHELVDGLERQWSGPSAGGSGFGGANAILRIERFGTDYEVPVVEGIDDGALASGVGHVPGSAGPGKVGNYALAGHRVTHGEPFHDFLELRAGDRVEVETRRRTYTYVLDDAGDERAVDFGASWVLAADPYDPGAEPTERLITLVTCSEIFHTDQRQVVFGHLESVEPRSG